MSRSDNEKLIKQYVEEKMPKRIKTLVGAAKWDLHMGPHSTADFRAEGISWPGYTSACKKIQEFIDSDMPHELWVDTEAGYVQESEPEAWFDEETGEHVEPMWDDFVRFDNGAIMRAVFGELVGNGID